MEKFNYQYNCENIRHSEANRCYMITFTYKNVDVSWDIDHPQQKQKIIFFICPIIDKYGEEGYKKLKKAYNTISLLKDNYILIDNTAYKPSTNHSDIHPYTHYSMWMIMADGSKCTGEPKRVVDINNLNERDDFSYRKTFDNLKERVKYKFTNEHILPDKKHINEEKTLEFRNALKELEEIGVKYDSFSETFI